MPASRAKAELLIVGERSAGLLLPALRALQTAYEHAHGAQARLELNKRNRICRIDAGTPAAKAGLLVMDLVLTVSGKSAEGHELIDLIDRDANAIRGAPPPCSAWRCCRAATRARRRACASLGHPRVGSRTMRVDFS